MKIYDNPARSSIRLNETEISLRRLASKCRMKLLIGKKRRWAWVRLALGLLQMAGAASSVTLLVRTGITALALIAVTITGLLTTVSILLFGVRRTKRGGS